ncbi:hypothetical protein BC831DRAFT_552118 [Entophlyctis helioformis]|nr:hypothetical protein BC831DRAFT_552118 [Entophlyctis helioformis]
MPLPSNPRSTGSQSAGSMSGMRIIDPSFAAQIESALVAQTRALQFRVNDEVLKREELELQVASMQISLDELAQVNKRLASRNTKSEERAWNLEVERSNLLEANTKLNAEVARLKREHHAMNKTVQKLEVDLAKEMDTARKFCESAEHEGRMARRLQKQCDGLRKELEKTLTMAGQESPQHDKTRLVQSGLDGPHKPPFAPDVDCHDALSTPTSKEPSAGVSSATLPVRTVVNAHANVESQQLASFAAAAESHVSADHDVVPSKDIHPRQAPGLFEESSDRAAFKRALAELDAKNNQIAELSETVERLTLEHGDLAAERDELRQLLESAQEELQMHREFDLETSMSTTHESMATEMAAMPLASTPSKAPIDIRDATQVSLADDETPKPSRLHLLAIHDDKHALDQQPSRTPRLLRQASVQTDSPQWKEAVPMALTSTAKPVETRSEATMTSPQSGSPSPRIIRRGVEAATETDASDVKITAKDSHYYIECLTATMVGTVFYKFDRFGRNAQMRFFRVIPETRTIMWTKRQPQMSLSKSMWTNASQTAGGAPASPGIMTPSALTGFARRTFSKHASDYKSAFIETIQFTDPPFTTNKNFPPSSLNVIVIKTHNRLLHLVPLTWEDHEKWTQGIGHLIARLDSSDVPIHQQLMMATLGNGFDHGAGDAHSTGARGFAAAGSMAPSHDTRPHGGSTGNSSSEGINYSALSNSCSGCSESSAMDSEWRSSISSNSDPHLSRASTAVPGQHTGIAGHLQSDHQHADEDSDEEGGVGRDHTADSERLRHMIASRAHQQAYGGRPASSMRRTHTIDHDDVSSATTASVFSASSSSRLFAQPPSEATSASSIGVPCSTAMPFMPQHVSRTPGATKAGSHSRQPTVIISRPAFDTPSLRRRTYTVGVASSTPTSAKLGTPARAATRLAHDDHDLHHQASPLKQRLDFRFGRRPAADSLPPYAPAADSAAAAPAAVIAPSSQSRPSTRAAQVDLVDLVDLAAI